MWNCVKCSYSNSRMSIKHCLQASVYLHSLLPSYGLKFEDWTSQLTRVTLLEKEAVSDGVLETLHTQQSHIPSSRWLYSSVFSSVFGLKTGKARSGSEHHLWEIWEDSRLQPEEVQSVWRHERREHDGAFVKVRLQRGIKEVTWGQVLTEASLHMMAQQ